MAEHFQLRLVDSFMLAPTVRHLAFERADGTPLEFQPGQFLQVHFAYPDGKPTKRSYSVATVGEEDAGAVDASRSRSATSRGVRPPNCSAACSQAARSRPAGRTAASA